MTTNAQTPMLRQYHELKRQHPGALLFFRLGDFYELFYEDAVTGARELEITLTARNKERGAPVPMCGVPHHAAAGYIARLVRKGFRVAVCEQTEDAGQGKKLVRREVVRVITPGTALDPQLLEANETIYLAAMCGAGDKLGAAFLDLSTGEFRATEASGKDAWERLKFDLEAHAPREILCPASMLPLAQDLTRGAHGARLPLNKTEENKIFSNVAETPHESNSDEIGALAGTTVTPLDDWFWTLRDGEDLLKRHFNALTLEAYGLQEKSEALRAAAACLRYAQETQRAAAAHVTAVEYFEPQDCLILDAVTVRNLELVTSQSGARGRSLFDILNRTVTGMGARTLRAWLLRPSVKRGEIEARLDSVAELFDSQIERDRVRDALKDVADLERLTARLNMNSATPRDLLALGRSLGQIPALKKSLAAKQSSLLQILHDALDELTDARELIERAINEAAPARAADGEVIKNGYNAELDELRDISGNAKQTIAALEARERSRTGIQSLRVRFNQVFGYYIEISKSNLSRAPAEYERRQTLANAERYTTPELKELEIKARGAEDRICEIEAELFQDVCRGLVQQTARLQATARAVAMLDALAGLAATASLNRYARPQMHDGDEIEIAAGRHPVIEATLAEPFIPNDVYLNNSTERLLIITGPNMGGKSTVLRQTALICLLAQAGSFVPAERARLPVLDRIWTRVGASDDLARGRSTFMVEMTETAAILHNATPHSLVILDEIGRGTSTFDGLSLAWAVAEYLHDSPAHAAKTLFATHYHELTELAERLPGAQNYQITASEQDGAVVFLHKLERGRASKSYGIAVAQLAGLPAPVLHRAREVLHKLERYELAVLTDEDLAANEVSASTAPAVAAPTAAGEWQQWAQHDNGLQQAARRARRQRDAAQTTLFDAVNQDALDELRVAQVENLSPEDARELLLAVKRKLI